jgi:O-antigen ligase
LPQYLYAFFGKTRIDYLAYYRGKVFLFLIFLLVLSFMIGLVKNEYKIKKNTTIYTLLGIYSFLIFLSTVFSEFPQVAFWGIPDRVEGFYVSISYIILFFIVYNILDTKKDIKKILYVILGTNIVLGVIGLFDYFGYGFTNFKFIQKLILPDHMHNLIGHFQFKYQNKYIASFWGNPNYVGSYSAITFMLSFSLFYFKKLNDKFIFLSTIFSFILLIGSVSRAGMLGVLVSLFVFFSFHIKELLKNKENLIRLTCLLLILILIFIPMNHYGDNKISKDIVSLKEEAKTTLEKGKENIAKREDTTKYWIDNLEIEGHTIYIETSYNKVKINWENNQPKFLINGKKKEYKIENGKQYDLVFKENINKNNFKYDGKSLYWFNDNLKQRIQFVKIKEEIIASGNYNSFSLIEKAEGVLFNNNLNLASKRGYIWSRTIPLLYNESLFVGTGPETFVLVFPNNDFLGKLQTFKRTNQIVQKPHNMYLHIGVQYGMPALLIFLVFICIYFKRNYKKINDDNDIYTTISFSILAYLIAGIFNDTVIINSILFWIVLALGYRTIDKS